MDATGAHVLGDAIRHLERRGIAVLLSGITRATRRCCRRSGSPRTCARGPVFAGTPAAIAHAREIVHRRATFRRGSAPRRCECLTEMSPQARRGMMPR